MTFVVCSPTLILSIGTVAHGRDEAGDSVGEVTAGKAAVGAGWRAPRVYELHTGPGVGLRVRGGEHPRDDPQAHGRNT